MGVKKRIKKILLEERTSHPSAPWWWISASDEWVDILAKKIIKAIKDDKP